MGARRYAVGAADADRVPRYVRGSDVTIDELRLFTFPPRRFDIRDTVADGGGADDAPASGSPPGGKPEKGEKPMNGP